MKTRVAVAPFPMPADFLSEHIVRITQEQSACASGHWPPHLITEMWSTHQCKSVQVWPPASALLAHRLARGPQTEAAIVWT